MLAKPALPWPELIRRTWREALDDDVMGLAAQLAYYFFLALFPAILFLLAVASFFPLSNVTDDIGRSLGPFVSSQVLELIQDQMRRLGNNENGGLLTVGVAGALWSSSAAIVSIVGALNRAYDIDEGRAWWKVRLTAIALTVAVAVTVLSALTLLLAGPTLAESIGQATGLGAAFRWTWLTLQWPLVFALFATALGLVYYFGPDADQDWVWISPGAVAATLLWLVISLLFKVYIANFTDYNATYGTVGGVIVLLLWFYVSGLAILVGAELNAEIEHASPYGKGPGQKNARGKRLIGQRAARAFDQQQFSASTSPSAAANALSESTITTPRSAADIQEDIREKRARLDDRIDTLSIRIALLRSHARRLSRLASTAIVSLAIRQATRKMWQRAAPVRSVRKSAVVIVAIAALRLRTALHRSSERGRHSPHLGQTGNGRIGGREVAVETT